MYIATSLFGIGVFASFILPLIKWHLEDNSKWIYRKSHALKALIHADLDNTDNKPITEHLLEYYKPKKITPKLIRYFEENYPKALEEERIHRKQAQAKREELEVLFDQFKVIQKTNLKSIKQVQELGTDPENTQERWEQILEYLVDSEINRLTYHGLALPSLEERTGNY